MDPDIGSACQGSPRPPRCHARCPSMPQGAFGPNSCRKGITVAGRFSAGVGAARWVPTQRTLPVVALRCRQAGVRPVHADQVRPLVGAVMAHVIATPVCRSSKAMRAEATESCGRRPSAVRGRHAKRAVGRVASRTKGSGASRSSGMQNQGRTHARLAAAYGWKSAPKAPRIGPRVSPTPNASPVRVQLPMSPSGPSASWPTNIPSSSEASAVASLRSMYSPSSR